MTKLWPIAAAVVAGVLILWLLQSVCGGGTDAAWKKTLADTVLVLNDRNAATAAKKTADSLSFIADTAKANEDGRAKTQQVVEALAARNAAILSEQGAHASVMKAHHVLALAKTMRDSIDALVPLVVQQSEDIEQLNEIKETSTVAIVKLVADTVSLHERLGISQAEAERQRLRADTTADRLGILLRVAGKAPKGLSFLGIHFAIEIKPYLGAGFAYDLTTHLDSAGKPEARFRGPQAQIGISIARGN